MEIRSDSNILLSPMDMSLNFLLLPIPTESEGIEVEGNIGGVEVVVVVVGRVTLDWIRRSLIFGRTLKVGGLSTLSPNPIVSFNSEKSDFPVWREGKGLDESWPSDDPWNNPCFFSFCFSFRSFKCLSGFKKRNGNGHKRKGTRKKKKYHDQHSWKKSQALGQWNDQKKTLPFHFFCLFKLKMTYNFLFSETFFPDWMDFNIRARDWTLTREVKFLMVSPFFIFIESRSLLSSDLVEEEGVGEALVEVVVVEAVDFDLLSFLLSAMAFSRRILRKAWG